MSVSTTASVSLWASAVHRLFRHLPPSTKTVSLTNTTPSHLLITFSLLVRHSRESYTRQLCQKQRNSHCTYSPSLKSREVRKHAQLSFKSPPRTQAYTRKSWHSANEDPISWRMGDNVIQIRVMIGWWSHVTKGRGWSFWMSYHECIFPIAIH